MALWSPASVEKPYHREGVQFSRRSLNNVKTFLYSKLKVQETELKKFFSRDLTKHCFSCQITLHNAFLMTSAQVPLPPLSPFTVRELP